MRKVGRGAAMGILLAVMLTGLSACATFAAGPVGNTRVPQPEKPVELSQYLGRWYELYRYEAGFMKDCEAVSADYSLNPNGTIRVQNSCRKGSVTGRLKVATGKAKIVDGQSNANKLKVSFFGPFYGDYWVLDRGEDYGWSIVGEPSGRYLWVLSRDPNPAPEQRAFLRGRVEALGYDWSLVRQTQQP